MSKQVLNRPMFAKMRDGSIKPVQYHVAGAFILPGLNIASRALPYAGRGLSALKNTLPAIISRGKNLITTPKGPGTAVGPYLGGGGSGLPAIIKGAGEASKKGKGLLKMFGYGTAPMAIASLTDFSEQVEEKKKPYKPNMLDVGGPKKVEKEDKVTEEVITDINKGNLDDMISEKIDLFKSKLGDGSKRKATAGFGMLTEIGLNLMQAKGGNFLDKLSRSAIDPLKTFTKIGQAINARMDKITMAGIESGVKSFEADKDRALTEKQIEAQSKPDDVRTLEYLQQLPGVKNLPIEQVIRLSKNKAIMSDQEFYQELALNLTQGDPNITDVEIKSIFDAIQAASPGGGGQPKTFEEIEIKIKEARSSGITDSEIKAGLEELGIDPSKHGF